MLSPAPDAGTCPVSDDTAALITGTELVEARPIAEPSPRSWYRDPVFGTCVVRLTNRVDDRAPDDASSGLVNEYSRVQAFNADGSRIMIRGIDGTWYAYDATSLLPEDELPVVAEPRWDPGDPDVIFHVDGTRLLSYDITTGLERLVRDFADDFGGVDVRVVSTRWEGRPSDDGRYWGFLAQDDDWEPVAFVVYDGLHDAITTRDVRGLPGVDAGIDHVTMSPLGTYLLASFDRACERGELGKDAAPCGLMVYDRDLTGGRGLLRIIGHYDTALDHSGREIVVCQDIDTDHISMVDLETGLVTPLWPIDFSHTAIGFHFSGLGIGRPGWVVVSTYDDDPIAHTWMDDQVFLVETKPGGRIVRLAHTYSVVDDDQEADYWAEPHATVDRHLTRVLFGSNWGRSGTGEVDAYMIVLPGGWIAAATE
jgi:hypothetical protein